MMNFDLHGRGTTVAREARGGITTFLTMAYILFANPSILAAAGVPFEAAAAAMDLAAMALAIRTTPRCPVQSALPSPPQRRPSL